MGLRQNVNSDEFDILKRRQRQRAEQRQQAGQQGLKRQFARIGGLSSGSFIKQSQLARQQGEEQSQAERESIQLAEIAERRRQREIGEAREFSRGEREAQQAFGAEQAKLGRQFATQERLGSQEFGAGQAELGRGFAGTQAERQREFARGERIASQAFASSEAALGRTFTTEERTAVQAFNQKMQQLGITAASDEAEKQRAFAEVQADLGREFTTSEREAVQGFNQNLADREFKENLKTNAINTMLSAVNSGITTEEMSQFVDSLGVDMDANGNFFITSKDSGGGSPFEVTDAERLLQVPSAQTFRL
jgi:hypothetical protein